MLRNVLTTIAVTFIIIPAAALLWRSVEQNAWQSTSVEAVQAALFLSLFTSFISMLIILILGTPLAYSLATRPSWISAVIEMPIVLPPAVAGLGLLMAFGRRGILGRWLLEIGVSLPFSTAAVVIAQIFVAIPFFVRTAQVGFEAIPVTLKEAATVDGANANAVFRYVTLPLAWRALLAGMLIAWARALGEFGATILFAGNLQGETQTMPLLVFAILERDLNAAIWTALILVGVAMLVVILSRWLTSSARALVLEADQ
ncbi:MAG: ABC transporter permease [Chloroflexi bacterium]|nr:ABC transporter permease [Chloroflexota bacterium]